MRGIKIMLKKTLILAVIAITAACGGSTTSNTAKPAEEKPTTVGSILTEYKNSKDATVKKYTGKTMTIGGVAKSPPILPTGKDDDGVLVIGERGGEMSMTCFFKDKDKDAFSKITADQAVILKGTFDDSISTALKDCTIVKSE